MGHLRGLSCASKALQTAQVNSTEKLSAAFTTKSYESMLRG